MKKIKIRIMGMSMSIVLLLGMSIPVMAEERVGTISCNEATMELSERSEQLEQMPLPNIIGESIVIGEDENGILSVTLVDEVNSSTRSTSMTTSKTYIFQYENVLGIKKDAFEVRLTCDWVKAGADSKINELRGTAQALASGFTCTWTDSSYSTCNCWLELDVVYIGTSTYRFIASVFPLEGSDDLTFSYILF